MVAPDEDPRARLAALADAGRARREAAVAAHDEALRSNDAVAAAHIQARDRLMTYTTWNSLSGTMSLLYWAATVQVVAVFLAVLEVTSLLAMLWGFLIALALVVVAVVTTLRARREDIALRAALPFTTEGYTEVLDRATRAVRCKIVFTDERPPPQMFADLLLRLTLPTRLRDAEPSHFLVDASPIKASLLDEHCRWFPRWFRIFNSAVLQPVHAVYPIRSLYFY